MLSPVSPSIWQVQDSLSSTSSHLYSENDQTEDESEVFFSEGEGPGSVPDSKPCALGKESRRTSGSPLTFVNQRGVCVENGRTGSPAYICQTSASPKRIPTEGDLRFARKCSELRGYIRPLLELLNGLKTGRFEKGLNTFQQSTAMDRLRKILGVLQRPDLGEKYMGTLLQVEVMLKVWFPQVVPQHHDETSSLHNPIASVPPRWNQDQLHIPVKKRRLSWTDSDSQSSSSSKRFHEEERGQTLSDSSLWVSASETTSSDLEDDNAMCANQKELIENSRKTDSLNMTSATGTPGKLLPPADRDGSHLGMQDCSVSSTTPISDSQVELEMGNKEEAIATQGHSKSVKGEGQEKQVNSKSYPTAMSST
nr:circadian associated repressor of transcription a [Misgurnus anguillicaudatus]